MQRYVIFLSGPIGAGKTTLGRALAARIGGSFIDGDDHAAPDLPWYGSILRTSRSVVREGFSLLVERPNLVVAYPLRCSDWIFFRRHFGDAGVRPIFVSLRASYERIVDTGRGRVFDAEEHDRIRVMLTEGYGERSFSDLIVDTDRASFEQTLDELVAGLRRFMPA
uniref:Shikimate kinase n=1 Tax=Bosea sp. NBC_00436 TaxID=2969620 RepID=A0A9E7ZSB9_9HYPH